MNLAVDALCIQTAIELKNWRLTVPRDYQPRRQSKRWLDADCPREILAIYYDKREPCDPYTIIYADFDTDGRDYWFTYIGGSEDGNHYHGSLRRHEMAGFRDRNKNRARKWSDVHDGMKRAVLADINWMREHAND